MNEVRASATWPAGVTERRRGRSRTRSSRGRRIDLTLMPRTCSLLRAAGGGSQPAPRTHIHGTCARTTTQPNKRHAARIRPRCHYLFCCSLVLKRCSRTAFETQISIVFDFLPVCSAKIFIALASISRARDAQLKNPVVCPFAVLPACLPQPLTCLTSILVPRF